MNKLSTLTGLTTLFVLGGQSLKTGAFWGVFHIPMSNGGSYGNSAAMYEGWHPTVDWDPWIDALKALGANCISWFGSVAWLLDGNIDQATYLSERKHQLDYLVSKGMYGFPILCSYPDITTAPSQAAACAALAADAAQLALYPNIVGICITDEAISDTITAQETSDMAATYAAVKPVAGNIPVTCSSSPSGITVNPRTTNNGNTTALASYLDFFYYNLTGSNPSAADLTALQTAYPGKQFFFNGAYGTSGNWAATSGLVGSGGVRAASWFGSVDNTYNGLYVTDLASPNSGKIAEFQATLGNALPYGWFELNMLRAA